MIKKSVLLLVSILAVGTSLEATLLAYEGFDYATGTLNGQNDTSDGFRYGWATSSYNVNAGSLSMANYSSSAVGGSISGSGGAIRTAKFGDFNPNVDYLIDFSKDQTRYISVIMQRSGGASWFDIQLQNDSLVDQVKFGISSLNMFEANMPGGTSRAGAPTTDPYLIVLKMVAHSSGNDEVFLKAYSSADVIGSEPTSWTLTNSDDLSSLVTKFGLTAGSTSGARLDEIRIGTAWEDVVSVPEPSSLSLLAIVGGGLALIRKRFVI